MSHSKLLFSFSAAALTLGLLSPVLAYGAAFPLSVSSERRHLVDSGGAPFLINGDSPWAMMVETTLSEAEQYLEDRRQKGFNAVIIDLIEDAGASAYWAPHAPLNRNGDPPFLTEGDFSAPNEAYFAHADAVLQKALTKNIAVFLFPAYLGWGPDINDSGWYDEMIANGVTKMKNYGRYLGNRYKNYPNIIWVMGGDWTPDSALDEIRAMVQGIEETSGAQVFTVHNNRYKSGVTGYPSGESWIDLNSTYSDCSQSPQHLLNDYNRSGPIPFFFLEGKYENEGASSVCLRSQAYWSVLMGATGHFFGNLPIYSFTSGWQNALNSAGSQDMVYVKNFFIARNWSALVPDNSHTTLTSGYGNISDDSYAAAARTSDGKTVIVYTPSQRALTIDMTKISGSSADAQWFNPDTGQYTSIGNFPASGSKSFTPPSSGDWVLVLDAFGTVSAPTLTLSANPTSITSGQSSTLSWSATDATSCSAGGGWSGTKSTSGSQTVSPAVTTSYALTCTGSGGSVTKSVTITVGTLAVYAVAQSVSNGQTLSGSVAWIATPSDVSGTQRVEFLIDNTLKWTENISPYVFNGDSSKLDTTTLSNGSHTLTAKAYHNDGRTTTAAATVTISNAAPSAKKGDLNNDSRVDVTDLGILLSNWGKTTKPPADLNQDSRVDVIDLGILLSNWG